MPEIYEPSRALIEDWKTYFLERRKELFILPCKDGDVELLGSWMLANILMMMPLIKRNVPIERKHLHLKGIYNNKSHSKVLTEVSRTLEDLGWSRVDLGPDISATQIDSHNACYTTLGAFIGTMDIFTIGKTMKDPTVREVATMDYGDIGDMNINRMEKAFEERGKKVLELLSGDTIKYNTFRGPLICGALKEGQFLQFIMSAGPRTDADDHIFNIPVEGSFVSGQKNIWDNAIESRSAAKANHYNSTEMPRTQYQNRKLHLLLSAIRHLYLGDCGTTKFMKYRPTAEHVDKYIGMYFKGGDGKLVELTKERFGDVIDKIIEFRDPITCAYTDGYCETCGGVITRSFSRTGNVGFLSNVNTGAKAAQQVLSTKHLILTNAASYEIPPELTNYLRAEYNDIFLKSDLKGMLSKLVIGFEPKDISKTNDLKHVLDDVDLQAAYYSDIKYMRLGKLKDDGTILQIDSRVLMGSKQKKYPHLATELLSLLRNGEEEFIVQDKVMWLKLSKIDISKPIMQCTVVNQSIKAFVSDFSSLIMKRIEKYTSATDVMRDLTTMIWERVDPHVVHLSCMVKACLITSRKNFHIPVVEDPDKVMFSTLGRIIPMRSIGALMAFERINIAMNKPITYITEKQTGIYDEFMGFDDITERDMYWPEGTKPRVAV